MSLRFLARNLLEGLRLGLRLGHGSEGARGVSERRSVFLAGLPDENRRLWRHDQAGIRAEFNLTDTISDGLLSGSEVRMGGPTVHR